MDILTGVAIVLVLVILNGFFVSVEFALVRSHPTKLKSPEFRKKWGVASSIKLIESLDFSLSATQLGITIASLVLGWWGEKTFADMFTGALSIFGATGSSVMIHFVSTLCAFVVVTFLHVVIGELAAKSLAICYPEETLRLLAPPMRIFLVSFRPMILVLTFCSNIFLRLLGVQATPEAERVHSLAELAMLVSQSTERGELDETEEEMLQGVFGFSETVAREVMTPRTDLMTVPAASTLQEVLRTFSDSGFSRLPVTGEGVDDIVGVLLARDLLPYLHHGGLTGEAQFSIRRIMREPYFVPGTKSISELLNEFKRRKIHIAMVLDEHGGLDGVVTLEDVLEEIVGDIFDESDVPEKEIVIQENGDAIVDGGALVADINTRLECDIPEGDYDTIAGFIYTSLGRMPRPGDEIKLGTAGALAVNGGETEELVSPPKAQITVEKVTGRRIDSVRIHRPEPTSETPASEGKGIQDEA